MAYQPTEKQLHSLQEFRERLKDVWRSEFDDDHYLFRWLHARKFKLDAAEKMLREHLKWRTEFGADTLINDFEPPEVIQKYFAGGFYGHDKEGCPLWVDLVGRNDLKGLAQSVSMAVLVRHQIRNIEILFQQLLPSRSVEEGRRVVQSIGIFDMSDYGLKNLWLPGMEMYGAIARICEKNYPEHMKKCYIINVPTLFPVAYSMIRPFLDEKTARKVQVLGGNYKETLLKYFDAEHLPARYGGTMCDENGDPDCSAYICYGGKVPNEYFIASDEKFEFDEVLIKRRAFLELSYHVSRPNSKLKWKFKTDAYDIGFSVYFKICADLDRADVDEANKDIVDYKRIDASSFWAEGEVKCSELGEYVVRFDNTYSVVRAKQVMYKIIVHDDIIDITNPTDSHFTDEHDTDLLKPDVQMCADDYLFKIGAVAEATETTHL